MTDIIISGRGNGKCYAFCNELISKIRDELWYGLIAIGGSHNTTKKYIADRVIAELGGKWIDENELSVNQDTTLIFTPKKKKCDDYASCSDISKGIDRANKTHCLPAKITHKAFKWDISEPKAINCNMGTVLM